MREGTILPADITAAIVEQVKGAFPGEAVYTDLIPRDFARPCNMVGLARIAMEPLACGLSGVELLYQYKITTFSTVDEVHHSHLPLLDLRAMAVMGAFAGGFLQVGGRAPKVTEIKADTSLYDCAEVSLALRLAYDRADFVGPEFHELMQDLEMQVCMKKEKG